ncbi:hypothetical protein [Engelhardtia mirabilis]|uniref:Alpha/beta hydrolase family protein n=1 Tax=Engelhardtia mirabilis TaxID=2528011 RepID=A0A518BE89_9BACT|nr:Alpha/beta hydrolase family protein [Planctomycetes bacterium Pla133]QDU99608.1 Alpha/beta hydrolase family protein [Planctomycetes bacterium Pla86]
MSLLLALPADAPFAIGHVSGAWSGPSGVATAEVYYPATTAGEGTPVAAVPGGHPLVVFGHGFVMPASAYGYLRDGLVPEGFVVAMLTTGGELFPDHGDFAQDFLTVAEGLAADGADPASLFFEALSGRAAAAGHSMGGGASLLAAAQGDTFTAVCNLAAAETNPSAQAAAASVTQPLLMLSGGDDCVTPPSQQQAMWSAAASSCKSWITLLGGSHCQFASATSACEFGELFCSTSLGGAEQRALVLDLLVPWLRAVLAVEPAAWSEFVAVSQTNPGLATSAVCTTDLAVEAVTGLDAALAGGLTVAGAGLGFVVEATVDGAAVAFEPLGQGALELTVGASAPGAFDLGLVDLFGSLDAAGAARRYPALLAGPAPLGGTLTLSFDAGLAGPFVVAWSLDPGPPIAIPGYAHVLQLGSPLVVLASGATDAAGTGAVALPLPTDPALQGLTVRLQAVANAASGPSFTNLVDVTFE